MAKVEAADVLHGSTHPSVRGRWDYVRKKLRRRGVVEVNKSHPHCDTLEAVQVGIRELLTKHTELGAKVSSLTLSLLAVTFVFSSPEPKAHG